MKLQKLALALAGLTALATPFAHAEVPFEVAGAKFSIYGDMDDYLNYMHSSSGKSLLAFEDGAILRSRLGFKGEKPVDDGYSVKFTLEQGLNLLNGQQADPSTPRLFDRQAWVGLATPVGEFRVGRQNTAIFARGDYVDFTTRTLGSIINNFGVPSRYDSDFAYLSPRYEGLMAEAHYSTSGATTENTSNDAVAQFALDYLNGPYRVGYAGIEGKPNTTGTVQRMVAYNMVYADYEYLPGSKLYAVMVRSNNNGTSGSFFNGGSPLSNVGGTGTNLGNTVPGTDTGANTFYNIYQLSADYMLTPKLKIGGVWGTIQDTTHTSNLRKNANGSMVGAWYSIWKDTTIYAEADTLNNSANAGFRPAGSAGLPTNFGAASDVNGRSIYGIHLGFIYKL